MAPGVNYMGGEVNLRKIRSSKRQSYNEEKRQSAYLASHDARVLSAVQGLGRSKYGSKKGKSGRGVGERVATARPTFDFKFAKDGYGDGKVKIGGGDGLLSSRGYDDSTESTKSRWTAHPVARQSGIMGTFENLSRTSIVNTLLSQPDWTHTKPLASTFHVSHSRTIKSALKSLGPPPPPGEKSCDFSLSTSSASRDTDFAAVEDDSSILSPSPVALRQDTKLIAKHYHSSPKMSEFAYDKLRNDLDDYSDMDTGSSSETEIEEILEFPSSSNAPLSQKNHSASISASLIPHVVDIDNSRTLSVEIEIPPLDSSTREASPSSEFVNSSTENDINDADALDIAGNISPPLNCQIPDAFQVLPRVVEWKSPCATTKSQRESLASSFIFTAYNNESIPSHLSRNNEEIEEGEKLEVQERMGLGCIGVRKENCGVFDRLLERIGREYCVGVGVECVDAGEFSENLSRKKWLRLEETHNEMLRILASGTLRKTSAPSHTESSISSTTLCIRSATHLDLVSSKSDQNRSPSLSHTSIHGASSSAPLVSTGNNSFLSSRLPEVELSGFSTAQKSGNRAVEHLRFEMGSQDPFLAMVPTRYNGERDRGELLRKGPSLFDD